MTVLAALLFLAAAHSAGPGFHRDSIEHDGMRASPTGSASPHARHRPMWIRLSAKSPDDLRRAGDHLTARSLARRAARGRGANLIDGRDAPISPERIALFEALGAHVRVSSRWLNAVSVEASPRSLRTIAALPFVLSIEPVRRGQRRELEADSCDALQNTDAGASHAQLAQIDLLALHERGFRGQGVIVGVLDTGFHRVHEAFANPEHPLTVLAEWDFLNNDPNTGIDEGDPPNQHRHGTWILGTMAAYLPGQLIGAAFEASYVLAKTESVAEEVPVEEDFYVAGLEFVEAEGADLATSSLGYIEWYLPEELDSQTAVTTIAVNVATEKGLICLTAAGNQGHDEDATTNHLLAPSDAFEVISCGAVHDDGTSAEFSSDGPTADGRVKPELLARGVSTATVHSTEVSGLAAISGTSLSTPLIAGAAACILSARKSFDLAELRTALLSTASETTVGPDPLFVRGYGLVQADTAARSGLAASDLDLDGVVGPTDLAILLGAWGACSACEACPFDLDRDCAVGPSDLAIVLGSWSPVPGR